MSEFVLFKPDATAFDGNGICSLMPIQAVVSETAAGAYELYMVHPLDAEGRWKLLAEDCLIRSPVPVQDTPEINMPAAAIWRVKSTVTQTPLYSKLPTYTKAKTPVDSIDDNPSGFYWQSGKYYTAGDYCVYQGAIYVARYDNVGRYPGYADDWAFVKTLSDSGSSSGGSSSSSGSIYDPGKIAEQIPGGEIIFKVADYNSTYMRVRSMRGVTGYIKRKDCEQTGENAEPVVIPSRHITAQVFRIYSVQVDSTEQTVTISAKHYSYDFMGNSLYNCQLYDADPATAIAILQGSLFNDDTRTIASNITDHTVTGDWSWQNPIYALLDPDSGLAPAIGARVLRDNADFFLLAKGEEKGIRIAYGTNLLGVTWKWSTENVVTRIVPRATDKNGNDLFLPEMWIDSPNADSYPYIRVAIIDCDCTVGEEQKKADGTTTKLTEEDCFRIMRETAQNKFSVDAADQVSVQLTVDFLLLGDTEEFTQYRNLQRVNLYDNIRVVHGPLGLDATVQVSNYEWDAILHRYISITLGDAFSFGNKTVAGYQLASGSLTSRVFGNGSVNGSALAQASITARNIKSGTIETDLLAAGAITTEKLAAGSVTAETIDSLAITTEKLAAGAVTADKISADAITADKISAAEIDAINALLGTATIAQAEIGSAKIGYAQIYDLTADTALITQGSGEKLYIRRLAVDSAQMVDLTVGQFTVKASDGNYYSLDVDINTGNVTATKTTVTAAEIAAGKTSSGQHIIESDLTVTELNTASATATEALINKLTAGRIDVDTLFAREATIAKINTMDLSSNTYIRSTIGDWESGSTITQTISSINSRISSLGYGTVYMQPNEPSHDELVKGDIWIQSQAATTWQQVKDTYTWGDLQSMTWQAVSGIPKMYVWDGTGWQEMYDAALPTTLETEIQQLADQISLMATREWVEEGVPKVKTTTVTIDADGCYIATGGIFTVQSGNFLIDEKGNVTVKGTVEASDGKIGGWSIGKYDLYSGTGAAYVALDSNPSDSYAIWAGNETAGSAPFRVTRAGKVYLTSLATVDESGNEKIINLSNQNSDYPLWKLNYKTVKSVAADGTVTLSDDSTFNSARSVDFSRKSWSGASFTAILTNGKGVSAGIDYVTLALDDTYTPVYNNGNLYARFKANPQVTVDDESWGGTQDFTSSILAIPADGAAIESIYAETTLRVPNDTQGNYPVTIVVALKNGQTSRYNVSVSYETYT